MKFASVIFDFDSTVVDCETLDLVAEVALAGRTESDGVLAEVKRITALGMEGAIPFGESLARRMALIAPSRETVARIAREMVRHITPSFLAHRAYLQAHHDNIYIVSGGFDELIAPVGEALGLDPGHTFSNAFIYDEGGIATGIDASRPLAYAGGKARAIEEADIPGPRIIIGDGWTDYEIKAKGAAEMFVAYIEHARREKVVAQADAVAQSFDQLFDILEG